MLAQTIQRQVTIGENVRFLRKDGHEISGRLVELSQDHITLASSGKKITILIDMIGGWEVLQDTWSPVGDESDSKTVISEPENDSTVISGQGDDISGQGDDISGQGDDISGQGDDISGQGDDISGQGDDISGQGDDISGQGDDISGQGDDISGQGDDISGQGDDISGQGDDISGQGDDISGQEDDISGQGDDISGQEDDSDVKSDIPSDSHLEEALKITLEIEARFQAKLVAVRLEPPHPDFDMSAEGFGGKQISSALDRIKSKYEYALKVNELGAQYGRIQPLVSELETLITKYPDSSAISRLLGYFHWLVGNVQKAVGMYSKAARASDTAKDWYSLAVLTDNDALACYGFNKVYSRVGVSEYPDAWYVFVNLVAKHRSYSALADLSSNQEHFESEQDGKALIEASIYLLIRTENKDAATKLASRSMSGEACRVLATEALRILGSLSGKVSPEYIEAIESFKPIQSFEPRQEPSPQLPANILQGHIYAYKPDRIFGFIKGVDSKTYFFHRSALADEELREQIWDFQEHIQVAFETAEGPKGHIALNITLPRDTKEVFERAVAFAENGDYPQAINQMKTVLSQNPDYPSAAELHEKWREYARIAIVPRGKNPYARAKRVQLIEKDLDKAAKLFQQAIQQGDKVDSAVKDLAVLHAQRGNPQEAVRILRQYRKRVSDRRAVDNMLINFHYKAGQYDEAIKLLEAKLRQASSNVQKTRDQMQIASFYLHMENYSMAESHYKKIIRLRPNTLSAHRNLALCVFKRKDYDQAESLLNKILENSRDLQAEELLQAIRQERAGQRSNIDEIIIEITLPSLSKETSKFTGFFLKRCEFQGVPPARVQEVQEGEAKFNKEDVQKLEERARRSRTRIPRDRAEYYLSAAKILLEMEDSDPDSDPDEIYKYLGRSFSSRADVAVGERKPLDAAKELYAESLNVYDGYRSGSSDDQEASNALVRFLFSTLGEAQIPIQSDIPSVDDTLETILMAHTDLNRAFDAIAYLVFRSPRFAASRILVRLYQKSSLQAKSIEYLKSRGIDVSKPLKRLADFVQLWNDLQRKKTEEIRQVSSELRIMVNTEITTASLEDSIERIRDIPPKLFLELDQDRLRELENIFNTAHELCSQITFEEQERLCNLIGIRCQDLINRIEVAPTKVSIEELLPVIDSLQMKISERLENLYEQSTPQLTLRLAKESYRPNNDGELKVQIEVSNEAGCSPADALELVVIVEEDSDFTLIAPEIKLSRSLRGDDQHIFLVPLRVGKEALTSQVFSLPFYAQFRSRSDETHQTQVSSFPIRLYSEADFEVIGNPYAEHAAGGPVLDPSMFFGRDDLITNVANSILSSRSQSKCVVIYGQYRTGKSSILHHLKTRLQEKGNLLILDIGNIGAMLDPHSNHPLLYQILWTILQELQDTIEDQVNAGMPPLDLTFPGDLEYYQHPTPLGMFSQIFQKFQRTSSRITEWKKISVVLLVDEFSYLHELIEEGSLSDSFMKNWKALLQNNFFNAVLVGQDVMPRFKQRFPNEFGTTQDERVTYLRQSDAKRLIDEPVRLDDPHGDSDSTSRYRGKAIDRILELTAGSPFYIQILCNRLMDYLNRERSILVTEADVEQVKNEMIQGVNALGLDKFDNLTNSGDTSADAITKDDALAVLRAIARNSNNQSRSCSQHRISCETTSSVRQVLDDLVRREVINRQESNYYSIQVGLFQEWLLVHQ